MKFFYLVAFYSFYFVLSANAQKNQQTNSFSQHIVCSQSVKQVLLKNVQKEWWHDRLEETPHYLLFRTLFRNAIAIQSQVYQPFDPFDSVMDYGAKIHAMVRTTELMNADENAEIQVIVVPDSIHPWEVGRITCDEEWKFDAGKRTFEKIVKGIIPMRNEDVWKSMFYIPMNQPKNDEEKNNLPVLAERISYDVRLKDDPEFTKDSVFYNGLCMWKGNLIEVGLHDTEITIFNDDESAVRGERINITDTVKHIMQKDGSEKKIIKGHESYARFPHGLSQDNLKKLTDELYQSAVEGKTTAYSPQFPYTKALSKSEMKKMLSRTTDTAIKEQRELQSDTFITKKKLSADDITSLRFVEEWRFDPAKMILNKKVKGIVLLRDIPDTNGNWASKPLFYIPMNGSEKETAPKENIVHVNHIGYSCPLDSSPATWRTKSIALGVDTAAFPALMKSFFSMLNSGEIEALDAMDMRFQPIPEYTYGRLFTYAEVKSILNKTDTLQILSYGAKKANSDDTTFIRFDETDMLAYYMVTSHVTEKNVRSCWFNEEWEFDPDNMHFTKWVFGIAPELKATSDMGEFRAWKSLFYLPFNMSAAIMGRTIYKQSAAELAAADKPENFLGERIFSYTQINEGDRAGDITISDSPYWERNLEFSKREKLIKPLVENIRSGKITIYYPDVKNQGSAKKMSVEEFNKRFVKKVYDPVKEKIAPMEYYDMGTLGFNESWYYYKEKRVFHKKVNGIYFIKTEEKETADGIEYSDVPFVYIPMK